MDAFGTVLRQSMREHLGHGQETAALRLKMDALAQAANLVTIQSRDGQEIYATGMRPDLDLMDPVHWNGIEEHVRVQAFLKDGEIQRCSIEQVPHLALAVGSRAVRFADATRTMVGRYSRRRVTCYYIFEGFISPHDCNGLYASLLPPVDVVVPFSYTVKSDVMAQRGLSNLNLCDMKQDELQKFFDAMHPSCFESQDLEGHVAFEHISFIVGIRGDASNDDNEQG